MLERWAAGSPRPTAADHIELSAGQIERLNTSCPPSALAFFDGCISGQWGELRGLITEAGMTHPESVLDDFWKDLAELTEAPSTGQNGGYQAAGRSRCR